MADGEGLDCVFAGVSVSIPAGKDGAQKRTGAKLRWRSSASGALESRDEQQHRLLLNNVSGRIQNGKLEALMGPSGSGKTTLLSLLGGRAQSMTGMTITGQIRYNGTRLTKALRQRIGFVEQEDVLLTNLTVYETLLFTAQLRIARTIAAEARATRKSVSALYAERVEASLSALGLQKCKNTVIGDGFLTKGVSGGEKKRVAVAMELLMNPKLILLDEPTSGLDSNAALVLITVLQNLAANEGRALCASIHQPAFRIYEKLDSLLLLAEGRVLYRGAASPQVLTSFLAKEYALHMPLGLSLPDWLLDLASGHSGGNNGSEDSAVAEKLENLIVAFENPKFNAGEGSTRSIPSTPLNAAPPTPFADESPPADIEPMRKSVDLNGAGAEYCMPTNATLSPSPPYKIAPPPTAAMNEDKGGYLGTSRTFSNLARNMSTAWISLSKRMHVAENSISANGDGHGDEEDPPPPPVAVDAPMRQDKELHTGKPTVIARVFRRFDGSRWGANYGTQVRVLALRSWKERWSKQFSWENLALMLLICLVISTLWWQVGVGPLTFTRAGDLSGMLFFLVLFPAFQTLFNAIFTFPDERRILNKERLAGMYRLSAFYFGRTLADLPIELTFPTLLHLGVYFTTGLRLTPGAYFGSLGAVYFSVIISGSVGVFFGALAMSAKLGQVISAVFMLSLMLGGGFYIQHVPFWMSWLPDINYLMYSYNLVLQTQFSGRKLECSSPNEISVGAPAPEVDGAGSMGNDSITDYAMRCAAGGSDMPYALESGAVLSMNLGMPIWQTIMILVAWAVIFKTASYVALDLRTRKSTTHGKLK